MKKLYFLAALFLILKLRLFAQSTGLTTYSSSITGLNTNFYTSFVIDNSGTKWMGFNSGLTGTHPSPQLLRFNGTSWDSFPHVPSRKVNALAVDAANNLWIGTDTGLVMFNGSVFTTYCMANSNIASNKVISVACGGGKIYAGTNAGLCVLSGSTFTNYNHATNGLARDTIYCISYENASNIWLGNAGGLENFNGSSFNYFYGLGGIGNTKVNCIYVDPSSNKWLGTNNYGVVKFDNSNFFTMQQLCGPRPIQPGSTPYLFWPVFSNSITQGPNGGVCFFGGNSSGTTLYGNGLIEVTSGQVYTYNIFSNNSPTVNSLFLGFDPNSLFLYAAQKSGSFSLPFLLHKFDKNLYSDNTHTGLDYLDINQVGALMLGNSDFAWDLGNPAYTVPKYQNSNTLYAASFWMGGYHNGSLKMAAMTYRQNGMDFWPGPLDTLSDSTNTTAGIINPNCSRPVWKINRFDVANFIYNWNAGNVQNGSYVPPANFLSWPGNGTGNFAHNLAPYVDVNGNGIYDPIHDGDYPLIKGDQMIWWVFNDNADKHTETGGERFGVEVHASAYAYVCPNIADSNRALNYTTFYNYKIYNRSQNKYDSTTLGLWMDTDLGNFQDDYIGCDVMNNYGFTYNGDNMDEDLGGFTGYHTNLPAFACNILNGPMGDIGDNIDNNNNGVIDEANEKCLMNYFSFYSNTGDILMGNPTTTGNGLQYYNFITGKWKNGTPVTYGGNGTVPTNQHCKHLYPGNSDPYGISLGGSTASPVTPAGSFGSTGWTQQQAGVVKNDMRFLVGVGPFTMQPGGVYDLDYALVFSQDSANCSGDNICVLTRAQQDNIRVRRWFDNNTFPTCLSLANLGIQKNDAQQLDLKVYPNPANNYLYIEFKDTKEKVTVEIFDMLGNVVKGAMFNDASKYITIPVENLGSGIYNIRVRNGDRVVVKKFVKE